MSNERTKGAKRRHRESFSPKPRHGLDKSDRSPSSHLTPETAMFGRSMDLQTGFAVLDQVTRETRDARNRSQLVFA